MKLHHNSMIYSHMDSDSDSQQKAGELAFIARLTCVAYIIELVISWHGYIRSHRIFELTPVFPALRLLPEPLEWGIYITQILLLAWLCIRPHHRLAASIVLTLTVFCILRDLLLLQPYTYMYAYVIFTCSVLRHTSQARLKALQIMVCGVYFWAGFHKFNATFFLSVFPWFISPFYHFSKPPSALFSDVIVMLMTFITPMYEALIGIFLLFPNYRRTGTLMAFIMLIVVLLCLGPLGHNWNAIVWPWNIYLFILDVRLFLKSDLQFWKMDVFSNLEKPQLLSMILFIAAPALAIITPWYTPLGFKLYAGSIDTAEMIFTPDETFEHVPPYLKRLINPQHILNLADWSIYETNMAAAASVPMVLQQGPKGICRYLSDSTHVILRYHNTPPFYSTKGKVNEILLCP